MNITVLISITKDLAPDRVAFADDAHEVTFAQLDRAAAVLGASLRASGRENVAMVATNSVAFPILFFAAARAGIPFVPLNYRLSDDQLRRQIARLGQTLVVADPEQVERLQGIGSASVRLRDDVLDEALNAPLGAEALEEAVDADIACWLFTSGTTGEPKIVELKHENLASYVLGTVNPGSADESETVLVSVPPYHIAGLAAVLTSTFAGRSVAYLDSFAAQEWVDTVRRRSVTQAMVVPTMMQRILDVLDADGHGLPHLANLSYGGGRMPVELIERALATLPHVGFTNAYGLTETSSTITLLGPDDHRAAIASKDPRVRARLGSAGLPLPEIELEIRDESGAPVAARELGEIWVRGPQIGAAYQGRGSILQEGWFCTRDQGWLDEDGYLFLIGRVDDVIVRGGENLSPGEIEDVLRTHHAVADVAVVAAPDEAWGEVPVAVIVAVDDADWNEDELKRLVRAELRSSRVPGWVRAVEELPYNETGKLLRTKVREMVRSGTV